jgi:hypothetical protein
VEHDQELIEGTKGLKKNLKVIPSKRSIDPPQKTAILETSHIIRKVLQSLGSPLVQEEKQQRERVWRRNNREKRSGGETTGREGLEKKQQGEKVWRRNNRERRSGEETTGRKGLEEKQQGERVWRRNNREKGSGGETTGSEGLEKKQQ